MTQISHLWLKHTFKIVEDTSPFYKEGYSEYQSWVTSDNARPENPYSDLHFNGSSSEYFEWEKGWTDASFDFTR